MNILITHFFSKKNKGDAAINSVVVSQLKRAYPGAQITISSSDRFSRSDRFEGAKFVSSFLYESLYAERNPIMRILRIVYVLVSSGLWVVTKRDVLLSTRLRDYMHAMSSADLVMATGGGYLYARNNIREDIVLVLQLWPFVIARMLGKSVTMYAQSIGPFENRIEKFIAKHVLNSVHVIMTREHISYSILQKLGVTRPTITQSVDAAFGFTSPLKKKMEHFLRQKGITQSRMRVGITVKTCYRDDRQAGYEESIAKFCEFLVQTYNAQIVYVPQCTSKLHNDDDRVVAVRIVQHMQDRRNVFLLEDDLNHFQIKAILENMDYVVATRMHSAIFALTAFVPTLAIAYEHKTLGIMREHSLEKWCIALADVSPIKLQKNFDELYSNKDIYTSTLKDRLIKLIKESGEGVDSMKLALDKSLGFRSRSYFGQPIVIKSRL